jgi:hypothetical protein
MVCILNATKKIISYVRVIRLESLSGAQQELEKEQIALHDIQMMKHELEYNIKLKDEKILKLEKDNETCVSDMLTLEEEKERLVQLLSSKENALNILQSELEVFRLSTYRPIVHFTSNIGNTARVQ